MWITRWYLVGVWAYKIIAIAVIILKYNILVWVAFHPHKYSHFSLILWNLIVHLIVLVILKNVFLKILFIHTHIGILMSRSIHVRSVVVVSLMFILHKNPLIIRKLSVELGNKLGVVIDFVTFLGWFVVLNKRHE